MPVTDIRFDRVHIPRRGSLPFKIILVSAALLVVAGCGSSDLDGLELETDDLTPFARVEVVVPESVNADQVGLVMFHGDMEIPLPVFVGETLYIIAPFHPEDPMAGGEVSLQFLHGEDRGERFTGKLARLDPHPGAWDEFWEAFQNTVDEMAGQWGLSRAELVAGSLDTLEAPLIPAYLGQLFVDDETPNSLPRLASPEWFDSGDLDLLDALIGTLRLEDLLDDVLMIAPTSSPDARSPRSVEVAQAVAPVHTNLLFTGGRPSVVNVQSTGCRDWKIEINDARELSEKYQVGRRNSPSENDLRRKVLDDIGTATTIGSFLPGQVGWAVSAVGTAFVPVEALLNGTGGLFPSLLTGLEASVDRTWIEEDAPDFYSWSNVMVTARSTGWDASKDIASAVFSVLSTATSAAQAQTKLPAGMEGTLVDLVDLVGGLPLNAVQVVRDNAAVKLLDDALIEFCAQEWEVNVTGEPWTHTYSFHPSLHVDTDNLLYRPQESERQVPVTADLVILLNQDHFPGPRLAAEFDIDIGAIRVTAPAVIEIDNPLDLVEFQVTVADAFDASLEWTPGAGGWQGEARLTAEEPAVWVRTHVTSPNESDYPYVIAARSASTTGLRADGEPPRVAVTEIRLRELIVTPGQGYVGVGGSLTFAAADRQGNPVEVDWTATGGTIGPDGNYLAGRTPGRYTVTAVAKNNPRLTTTVTVVIADAACLAGTWHLREQDFLDQVSEASGGYVVQEHRSGRYVTTIEDDGTFVSRREAWVFTSEVAGGVMVLEVNSVETGVWFIEPGEGGLLVFEETGSTATAVAWMEVNGQRIPLPIDDEIDVSDSTFAGAFAFECSDDVLTLTLDSFIGIITSRFDRIDPP